MPQPESQLDSRNFVKLFKDCQVRDKRCTTTDLDLIFTKACTRAPWLSNAAKMRANPCDLHLHLKLIAAC